MNLKPDMVDWLLLRYVAALTLLSLFPTVVSSCRLNFWGYRASPFPTSTHGKQKTLSYRCQQLSRERAILPQIYTVFSATASRHILAFLDLMFIYSADISRPVCRRTFKVRRHRRLSEPILAWILQCLDSWWCASTQLASLRSKIAWQDLQCGSDIIQNLQ